MRRGFASGVYHCGIPVRQAVVPVRWRRDTLGVYSVLPRRIFDCGVWIFGLSVGFWVAMEDALKAEYLYVALQPVRPVMLDEVHGQFSGKTSGQRLLLGAVCHGGHVGARDPAGRGPTA